MRRNPERQPLTDLPVESSRANPPASMASDASSLTDAEPFGGILPAWVALPSNWGAWWFTGTMMARMILWIFVLGYLMQQREISSAWHRDQFFWAILASLVLEYPLYVTLAQLSRHQATEADVVAARFQGQIVAHIFAFVAFFRTDTMHFARSESGYCAVFVIVLIDALCIKMLRRLF
jgi:hypothetical protein